MPDALSMHAWAVLSYAVYLREKNNKKGHYFWERRKKQLIN